VKRLAAAADLQPYLADGHGSPADVSAHTIRHSVTGVGIESHIRHRIFTLEGCNLRMISPGGPGSGWPGA
jgi:hypothetical protein